MSLAISNFECIRLSSVRFRGSSIYWAQEMFNAIYTEEERREIRREAGKLAAAATAKKLVEKGEATTIEEAIKLNMSREALKAKYTEEERSELGREAMNAAAQKLIDRGEAATLEEARVLQASRAGRAAIQKLVDSGEAATIKDAHRLLGVRVFEAKRAKYTEEEISEMSRKTIHNTRYRSEAGR